MTPRPPFQKCCRECVSITGSCKKAPCNLFRFCYDNRETTSSSSPPATGVNAVPPDAEGCQVKANFSLKHHQTGPAVCLHTFLPWSTQEMQLPLAAGRGSVPARQSPEQALALGSRHLVTQTGGLTILCLGFLLHKIGQRCFSYRAVGSKHLRQCHKALRPGPGPGDRLKAVWFHFKSPLQLMAGPHLMFFPC